MGERELSQDEKEFVHGCVSRNGKVNVLDNSIECNLDGITLVKNKKDGKTLREG